MRIIFILLICLCLYGCATPTFPSRHVNIGMTKQEVFAKCGNPSNWNRHSVDGHIYESWNYYFTTESYDFADDILTGYSRTGRYYSKSGVEDIDVGNMPAGPLAHDTK